MPDGRVWLFSFNVLAVVAIAWRARASCRGAHLPRLGSMFHSFHSTMKRVLCMTPPHPLHHHLKGMADKRLQEQVVWACPWVLFAAVCYNSIQLCQDGYVPAHALLYLNLAIGTFGIVGAVRPDWMTPRVFLCYHFCIYVTLIIIAIVTTSRIEYVNASRVKICVRFMLSLIHAKPMVSLSLGSVYVAAVSAFSPWRDPVDVRQELFVSLMVSISAAVVAWSRDSEFLAILEAKASRQFESTADGLLSSVCDAVVHLSKELQLSKPCALLAALLLRSSSDVAAGVHFSNLAFDATERARLIRFLERPISDTYSLHMSFRDSWGMPIKVELFHARGVDLHDELIHIVGVKEDSEEPRVARPGVLRDSPELQNSSAVASIPESCISVSTSDSRGPLIDPSSTGMAVLIDEKQTGLPVLRCSPDFFSLCGPICEGPKLLQWVINRADFMRWANRAYNDLLNAHDADLVQGDVLDAQPFRIRLELPHMGPRVLEVSANAKFKLPSFEDPPEGDDGGAAIAQGIWLMLEDVVFVRRGRQRRARSLPLSL
ncbi:unnamed protein product [Prorocentrum cordatum]|uniref:Uncharacterized protein n=1 Tax=Prorocentrum cordatum TaxID=2364126 RepID=A0ABN9V1J2_9DINO|nr:unnamed protein product [Polarella glacialis]